MGVSKNSGTPKCMVYNGKPFKMDNLGAPPFKETSISHLGKFGKSSTQICQTSGGYLNSLEGNLPTIDFSGAILVARRQTGFIQVLKGLPSVQYTKTIQKPT